MQDPLPSPVSHMDGINLHTDRYSTHQPHKQEEAWQTYLDAECESAFQKLKGALPQEPILSVADPSHPFILQTPQTR